MIAGCIDRMRHSGCTGCQRRSDCAPFLKILGGGAGMFAAGSADLEGTARRATPMNAFFAFLGELAKAAESKPAEARAEEPPKPKGSPFRRQVERQLEPMLATGTIRIGEVARQLGYSRQTLYRRLKSEGVTFEELLDQLRRSLALRYLGQEGLSVKETAYRLGFSDPAAFSRAFKRWTGRSPSELRG